ncbi:glucose 1-dehydrogenase [Bowmanella denitrificans]|uniref:Glucose 1-dehydrogenase n=1 Tax=Bowmanella denitrificans TaxID=366582 RepID=A0ABN0XKR7_9ALTE
MELGLEGKRVVVTGASRGIGAAIAERFLAEGAHVCLVARHQPDLGALRLLLQERYAHRVVAQSCDCTQPQQLDELRAYLMDTWGGVDILVANVGDGRSVADPIPTPQQWQQTWQSNFESALQTARTFISDLQHSKGVLLFVSSIAGKEAFGAPVDYSTAKAALMALAKNMSAKLAKQVRVNVIAPGNVYFPGGSWDEKLQKEPERIQRLIETSVPMGRFATPEEIAAPAVFLCSDLASFITGSTLVVDGGQTVGVG